MSNFAERLRQAMFDKRYKAIDVARGTNITPSIISRYLSGTNQPSRDNLFAVAKFLRVSSEWLLSSPEAPESKKPVQSISSHQDKIIELLERTVAERDEQNAELVKNCDALAEEVTRLGKPNKAHKELVEVIDTQKAQIEKQVKTHHVSYGEVLNLKAQVDMLKAQTDQWRASSEERHTKGKAKVDLAIAKNKNTLRIKTTRKRKLKRKK